MRYAIVSDIHSNLQAWNAVLLDIRSLGVDRIICLGDIVGYGPNPVEVLESVHANVDHFVLGNHDAVICSKLDDELFADSARTVLEWTRQRVGRNAAAFLSRLPLTLDGGTFRCAHGDFADPGYFNYVTEPHEAMPSWNAVGEQLLFVGHTHLPSIFLLGRSGTPHRVPAQDFVIEPEKRYIVNPGSVGQPRDGDARASYCVYDQDAGEVRWRRIPFDIDACRAAIATAGIPAEASCFLDYDPRKGVRPLRDIVNFSPATNPRQAAHNVEAVHTLEVLQKRVRRWKLMFALSSTAALLLMVAVARAWMLKTDRHATIGDAAFAAPVRASIFAADTNMLSCPTNAIAPGSPIAGWTVFLSDTAAQGAGLESGGPQSPPCMTLQSDGGEIRVSSRGFIVEPGTKLQMSALFRHEPGFTGDIWIGLELTRQTPGGETINHINPKPPSASRKDGWLAAQGTVTMPPGAKLIRFEIYGKFNGNTRVSSISLKKKQASVSED
ncbi:MAG: metallophosphoesterase family protein [bacterium]